LLSVLGLNSALTTRAATSSRVMLPTWGKGGGGAGRCGSSSLSSSRSGLDSRQQALELASHRAPPHQSAALTRSAGKGCTPSHVGGALRTLRGGGGPAGRQQGTWAGVLSSPAGRTSSRAPEQREAMAAS
jgi:hypothetical protein